VDLLVAVEWYYFGAPSNWLAVLIALLLAMVGVPWPSWLFAMPSFGLLGFLASIVDFKLIHRSPSSLAKFDATL
jgi:hypothetical protein